MVENRYRKKEKQRRQFTMTKTKAVIAFLLSLAFSLILSPAFDKVARLYFYRLKEPDQSSGVQAGSAAPVAAEGSDSATSGSGEQQSSDAVQRLKRITEQGRAAGKKAP